MQYKKILVIGATASGLIAAVAVFAASISLTPVSDGTYKEWSTVKPPTTTQHYTVIDESTCNTGLDYISTTSTGQRDSFNLSLTGIPNGSTITKIAVETCHQRLGTAVLGRFYRLNGVNSSVATTTFATTTWITSSSTWSGLSVVKTSTTTLQGAVQYVSGTDWLRVSKLRLIVDYTP